MFSCLVFLCYFSHLSAYVFLFLACCIFSLFYLRFSNLRTYVASILPLLLPSLLFLIFIKGSGTIGKIRWNTFVGKIMHVAGGMITSYNYFIDFGIGMIYLCIFFIFIFLSHYRKAIFVIKPAILASSCVFWIAFFLCPSTVFTAWSADSRFVPVALILTLLSFKIYIHKNFFRHLFIILVLILIVRIGEITYYWKVIDNNITQQIQLFNHFPKGTKIFPIVFLPKDLQANKIERPVYHIIHYSTIYRHTFSPTIFAIKGQHLLNIKDTTIYISYIDQNTWIKVNWKRIFTDYDYFWCYNINENLNNFLKTNCKLIIATDHCKIYKVLP